MKVAVVIPARNELATIRDVVARTVPHAHHVFVVDDGSTDGTGQALRDLPAVVLRHDASRGKGAALRTGIASALAAGADAIVTVDADGQHRPEDLPRFIAAAAAHPAAVIIGSRMAERAHFPTWRYRGNCIAAFWLSWACGQWVEDSQCGFRLFPRRALEHASSPATGGFVYESEILINVARAGHRIVSVPIAAIYAGDARASYYRPWRDTTRIVRMVAAKLLARGLYLPGLLASQREARAARQRATTRPALAQDLK